MTRARVLRVITRLNIGGPAIHAALLASRLDRERFETLLVAGREGPAEGSMWELGRLDPGLRITVVPALGRDLSPARDLRALASVIAIARAYRPHIVHTHLAKAGFVGRIAGRLAGARAVLHTYHGSVFRGYFGERESALYLAIERALGWLSSRVIAITPRQRQDLVALGVAPAEKIVTIPLGLDLEPFRRETGRGEARAALGLPPDGPLVGIVARLVPVKDVATFLRAFALARERVPGVRAFVVGDGEERAALERLSGELGLGASCRFVGWRADMPNVYAAADVVALSSLNEGSPVSLIEAMAAGRPVVATAVGGVPDVVRDGETGSLVPPRDPAALAAAMTELLLDGELARRYGEHGRAAAYPRFDASRLVSDIERLYDELLGRVGP